MITPAQRMASAIPQWLEEKFVDPLAELKRRPIPPRRVYPLNINLPAARNKFDGDGEDMEFLSVGSGAPIYMEPEEGDEAVHRFRSLKSSAGEGAEVLSGAEDGDLEVIFKRIKEKDDSPFSVTADGTTIRVGGNDVDQTVNFNIGGNITTKDGLVQSMVEGVRGGWGSLATLSCDDTAPNDPILEWQEGLIVGGTEDTPAVIVLELGDCSTNTEGS